MRTRTRGSTRSPARISPAELRARLDEFARDRMRLMGETTLRPEVLQSWERCLRYGLSPGGATPRRETDTEADAALVEMLETLMAPRLDTLRSTGICLSVTNADGVILRQWVGNADIMNRFERLDVVPGFSASETAIGTSSATALVTKQPTIVRGAEHFAPQFSMLTSAGAVIAHPVTRRTLGALHLTCSLVDTSPVALAWVCDIVADIERRLLESSTHADQLLLRGFLQENRDARHAVVAVNSQTAITNAAAAHLLGNVNQAELWEYASTAIRGAGVEARTLTLGSGHALRVDPVPVLGEDLTHGVILRLSRAEGPDSRPVGRLAPLGGLAGHGDKWTNMRRHLARAGREPILLVGESGVGKASIARALMGGSSVSVDVANHGAASVRVAAEVLAGSPRALILLHVDTLPPGAGADLASALGRAPGGTALIATSRTWPAIGSIAPELVGFFFEVIGVPALHERSEDIPELVATLTQRCRGGEELPRWMPDALRALTNCRFPENVRSLDRVVAHVVAASRHDYIGVGDLPTHVGSKVGRRPLTGLEQIEADAILQALRAAGLNKQRAAETLGIARSTLYRKMRAMGLDVDSTF